MPPLTARSSFIRLFACECVSEVKGDEILELHSTLFAASVFQGDGHVRIRNEPGFKAESHVFADLPIYAVIPVDPEVRLVQVVGEDYSLGFVGEVIVDGSFEIDLDLGTELKQNAVKIVSVSLIACILEGLHTIIGTKFRSAADGKASGKRGEVHVEIVRWLPLDTECDIGVGRGDKG